MSSVRKRTLPSGETRWQVDYRDQGGARRSKQFQRKSDATAFETKVRAEIVTGTHVADTATVTVREAADLWLASGQIEGLEASTMRQRREHVRLHIVPLIGEARLSRLTTPMVKTYRDTLLATRSRALSNAILGSFRAIIKEARGRGLIGHDPVDGVKIKKPKRDKKKIEIPSKDEIRALVNKSVEIWPPTLPWRPLILTAMFAGLRSSELRGLVWANVDLDGGVIRVSQRADYRNVIGVPKSEAGTRDVPMAPIVVTTLRAWKLACPRSDAGTVFSTRVGTMFTNSNVHQRCWKPLKTAAGLTKRYTFHALRHVAASLFIEQGWTPKKVQQVMGHQSIQMTYDTYGHLWEDRVGDQEAMAQIEARLLA